MVKFLKRLIRSFQYAIVGWNNYDWDYSYFYELMNFKLTRMLKELKENGVAEHDKQTLQSLRVAIKLSGRIMERDYGYTYYNALEKKYGKLQMTTGAPDSRGLYPVAITRPNVITPQQKQDELNMSKVAFEMEGKLKHKDINNLCDLIAKYSQFWWD